MRVAVAGDKWKDRSVCGALLVAAQLDGSHLSLRQAENRRRLLSEAPPPHALFSCCRTYSHSSSPPW